MKTIVDWSPRVGAGLYGLWGVAHLAAAMSVFALADHSAALVRGRLQQDAFYVLFFAIAGILIALTLNWRNDKQGYWMNAALLGFADIPFVVFVLIPGLTPWWPGVAGPLLWLAAFLFTSIGRFFAPPPAREHF